MDIASLWRAIKIVETDPILLTPQAVTYQRTYPALLSAAKHLPRNPETLLCQLSTLAYGWMPRIVRLDPEHVERAAHALDAATAVATPQEDPSIIKRLAECLHSVVGASKVLHLLSPEVFPIWDTKVARVWGSAEPVSGAMTKPQNYLDYASEIHDLIGVEEFESFYSEFNVAYSQRLGRLGIQSYRLKHVRAIEAAAFELASGDYEDA